MTRRQGAPLLAMFMPWSNFVKWPQSRAKKALLLWREGYLKLTSGRQPWVLIKSGLMFSEIYLNHQVISDSVLEFGGDLDIMLSGKLVVAIGIASG